MAWTAYAPANFVPMQALACGNDGNNVAPVSGVNPLPIQPFLPASGLVPTEGTSATTIMVGPISPVRGRVVWLSLSGTWTGTVQLLRSVDGGTTKLPLTIGGLPWGSFSANCNEPVVEETDADATLYLQITPLTGTVVYRVSQ